LAPLNLGCLQGGSYERGWFVQTAATQLSPIRTTRIRVYPRDHFGYRRALSAVLAPLEERLICPSRHLFREKGSAMNGGGLHRTIAEVLDIVMAYGSDPRNKFLDDPRDDSTKAINPALATMPTATFDAFLADLTQYIRVDKGMPDVIVTSHALRACTDWASLAWLVFALQS
jgi:hypothetical protein